MRSPELKPFRRRTTLSPSIRFLAGIISTLALVLMILPFLLLVSMEREGSNLNRQSSVPNQVGVDTLNVLLLEVHLEGNLGDEMETAPLLDFLERQRPHFRVVTTAALSGWLEGPDKQLSYRSVRQHGKIGRIITMDGLLSNVTAINDEYDLVILAPGPWKLFRLKNDVWKGKAFHIDVLFAGSIISEPEPSSWGDLMEAWNPKFIAVRETRSFQKLQSLPRSYLQSKDPILIMSGDLTNSFQHVPSTLEYWKRVFNDREQYPASMSIIFPRANNAEQSISFKGRTVVLETWDNNDQNSTVVVPGHEVIFATSSAIEDARAFQDWMYKYYDRFKQHQFVVCDTVEQLMGLISTAQHVYTDRYHPGVMAHVLGVDFSILRYEEERDKLVGLRDLVYNENISASTVHDVNNVRAFQTLEAVLEGALHKKRKRR